MIRIARAALLLAGLAACVGAAPATPGNPLKADTSAAHGVSIVFSCVLQVEESDKAAARLIAQAESLGGWFTRRSKTGLRMRIPSPQVDAFINGLGGLGAPLDRNLQTQSLEGESDELNARLKARRSILQDYYAMLKESGDSTIFTIQNEIVKLQSEIEQTEGQILKLQDRMDFASVTVDFRFQERSAPLTTGQSRFPWLNRLDLPAMMGRFDYVHY